MAVSMKRTSPWIGLVLLAALLVGPACNLSMFESAPAIEETVAPDADEPALKAFFSTPGTRERPEGIDELIRAIDGAQESVLVAMYNFTLKDAGNALLAAHERGIDVRVVLETDALDGEWAQELRSGGVAMASDNREGLMHYKFVVIDEQEVWTGSWNLTTGGTYYDNNNLVRIRSQAAAENYVAEFREMFDEDKFGPDGSNPTPNPLIMLGGTRMEFYFSPEDAPANRVVDLLYGAKESVEMMAYSFTLDEVGEALQSGAARGLDVRVVCDAEQMSGTGAECPLLQRDGLDVRVDSIEGLMHHKVIVIDSEIVIFGSFNFTRSANIRNDENLVVVYDAELARAFQAEFEQIYELAVD